MTGTTSARYRGCWRDKVRDLPLAVETQTFANLPGLLAKFWLRDPETNTYGGLYIWADQEAYGRSITGEVFNAIKADGHL